MASAVTDLHTEDVVVEVDALTTTGHVDEATALARRALAGGSLPRAIAAVLRLRLSSILFMTDRAEAAVTEAEIILAEPGLPEDLYGAAELARLLALVAEGDVDRARHRAQTVLAGDDGHGSDAGLAGALSALAFAAQDEGRPGDALAMRHAAVQRADRLPREARHNQHPRLALVDDLTALGRFDEADSALQLVRADIEVTGDRAWSAAAAIAGARLHVADGRLDEARTEAAAALSTAEASGARTFATPAHTVLASVALVAGDLRVAEDHLTLARPRQRLRPTWLDARLAMARSGPGGAPDLVTALCDRLPVHRRLLVEEPAAAAWLVRATLAASDRHRADAVAACAELLAIGNPQFPSLAAAAAHARALLGSDSEGLGRAAAGYRHPWAQASAHEDAGVACADAGRRSACRAALDHALDLYTRIGAARDASRVRDRLADLPRRRRGGRHARAVSGWASLTDTERRVAHVVAEGLTNAGAADRLFLSRHTVDFHLRQIFRKLGIRSRVGLTRIVLDHPTADHQPTVGQLPARPS